MGALRLRGRRFRRIEHRPYGDVAGIERHHEKARQEAVTDAHFDVADAKGRARLGSTETVVIEGEEGEELLGRSRREAPEIDAIIRLPRLAARGGRFVKARLTAYDSYEFSAEPA